MAPMRLRPVCASLAAQHRRQRELAMQNIGRRCWASARATCLNLVVPGAAILAALAGVGLGDEIFGALEDARRYPGQCVALVGNALHISRSCQRIEACLRKALA
jgi:hypothetical protein